MMTGKVKSIEANGQWNNMNKFQVTVEDGKSYTFFSRGEFKHNVGEDIKFEVTNAEYGNAKLVRENNYNNTGGGNFNGNYRNGDKSQQIIRQTVIKASAEFNAQRAVDSEQVIADATKFLNWINNG
jgi:hypothetical protein